MRRTSKVSSLPKLTALVALLGVIAYMIIQVAGASPVSQEARSTSPVVVQPANAAVPSGAEMHPSVPSAADALRAAKGAQLRSESEPMIETF
jgi:hypothetical protein